MCEGSIKNYGRTLYLFVKFKYQNRVYKEIISKFCFKKIQALLGWFGIVPYFLRPFRFNFNFPRTYSNNVCLKTYNFD